MFSKNSQGSNFVKIRLVGPEFMGTHDEASSRFSQFGNTTKIHILNNFVACGVASFNSCSMQ